MPCLNETETIQVCVAKAQEFLAVYKIKGEVIVADNGSTDGSQKLASEAGARVVHIAEKGYGSALLDRIGDMLKNENWEILYTDQVATILRKQQ